MTCVRIDTQSVSCMYDSVDGLSRRHLPLEWSGGALAGAEDDRPDPHLCPTAFRRCDERCAADHCRAPCAAVALARR